MRIPFDIKIINCAAIFVILLFVMPSAGSLTLEDRLDGHIRNEIARREPGQNGSRISVLYRKLDLSGLSGGKEKINFKLDFPENRRLAGKVILPVDILVNGRIKGKVIVSAVIDIFRPVAAAHRQIKKGETLAETDVEMLEKNISNYPGSVLFDGSSAVGRETKVMIPKGTVLLEWMLRDVPAVKEGDIVDLIKTAGSVRVQTNALALEDGYKGKMIKVRNLDTEKIIHAKVTGSKEVEAI